MTVRGPEYGRRPIGLAIPRARDARRCLMQPLGVQGRGRKNHGYRALAINSGGKFQLRSRNDEDLNEAIAQRAPESRPCTAGVFLHVRPTDPGSWRWLAGIGPF
jgi:hypothetical protein